MSAYFGNGYLLSILQRGASPVVKSRPKVNQPSLRVEETFATTGNQSLEVQTESLHRPVTAPAVTHMPSDGVPTRPWRNERAEAAVVATDSDSREVPALPVATEASQTLASPKLETHQAGPLESQVYSTEPPLLQTSSEGNPSSSSFSPAPASPQQSVRDNQPKAKSGNKPFELRMPENFYDPAKLQTATTIQPQIETEELPPVSTAVAQPRNDEAPIDHISESAALIRTRRDTPAQTEIVAAPAGLLQRRESQTISSAQNSHSAQPAPQNPLAPPSVTPQLSSVVNNVANQEPQSIAQPTALLPVRASEALVPTPRLEQPAELLNLRQPPMAAPPAAAPQARLRINRIDIQVVNNMRPAAPSEARAPDVSQMLEKRHLGRVALLL